MSFRTLPVKKNKNGKNIGFGGAPQRRLEIFRRSEPKRIRTRNEKYLSGRPSSPHQRGRGLRRRARDFSPCNGSSLHQNPFHQPSYPSLLLLYTPSLSPRLLVPDPPPLNLHVVRKCSFLVWMLFHFTSLRLLQYETSLHSFCFAGFGEASPEAKAATNLNNFFTFLAVKIVLAQLEVPVSNHSLIDLFPNPSFLS